MLSRSPRGALLGLLIALFCTNVVSAQTVTRGPYLQLATADSIVIRWRTDIATDSVVRFGDAPGNLTSTEPLPLATTEHEVEVTGLLSDTRYYYSVGDSSQVLAGDDVDHFFATAPDPGTSKPTRIWGIGDSGTADNNAIAVRDAYKTVTGGATTDLWLMLGDNAYSSGTQIQYQAAVFSSARSSANSISSRPRPCSPTSRSARER